VSTEKVGAERYGDLAGQQCHSNVEWRVQKTCLSHSPLTHILCAMAPFC
jgi:hypothetical protein